jgi:EAL domain-containing protein (putative c-di-GMP-specific phosphodiesterase class I)
MTIEPLANPLDMYASTLQLLLDRYFRPGQDRIEFSSRSDREARLELIRHAVDASGAAEIDTSNGQTVVTAGHCDSATLNSSLLDRITKVTDKGSVLGFACVQLEDEGLQLLSILPASHSSSDSALVLINPASNFLRAGEPVAAVLQALWSQQQTDEDPMVAEIRALSVVRSQFGRLPIQIYQKCFDNYSRLLHSLTMVFEPVMGLSEKWQQVGIHSWEALARRDLTARRAPLDILKFADTWGDRFVIERDITLAVKAITSYSQAHAQGPWRHDSAKPVSINVSVRSLLSGAYERALGQAISEVGMAPRSVTLEISEGDAIEPLWGEEAWGPSPIAFFQNKLRELSRSLRVNFAIDDFGVGYASLDRVSSLDLTQIKVDRAILHHSLAKQELQLVVQLAKEALDQGRSATERVVVVEGVDSESPISLYDLRKLGITYVQGYITGGHAKPSLEPLSDEVRREVASRVRGKL